MSRHLELQKKYNELNAQNKKEHRGKFSKDLGKLKVKIIKGSTPISTKVIRNKKLDVVIVSVNYNDYLSVTLSHNSKIFDNITVVTSSQDILCKKICEKFGAKYVVTDIMYNDNAKFNKGKAINEGLRSIENPDFILLIDADIIVSNKIDLDSIDEDYLYTSDRYICKSYNLLQSYINSEKKNEDIFKYESNHGIGFFQLFNINHNSIDKDKVYPEFSNDASWDDLLFRDKFPKRNTIDNTIIHLGDPYQNWTGRVTSRFLSDEELFQIINSYVDKKELSQNDWGVFDKNINTSRYGKFNIVNTISFDYHYSGWSYCLEQISILNSKDGIDFDPYLEKSFCWHGSDKKIYQNTWVGILHTPINTDKEYIKKVNNIEIFDIPEFIESLKYCKGLYTFSDYEKSKIEDKVKKLEINLDINVIRHTTRESKNKWNINLYKRDKKILHVGWWLRNIDSFYNLKVDLRKVRLKLKNPIEKTISRIFNMQGNCQELSYLNKDEYENILNSSVLFLDLIDSVAVNTLIECIENNVPIIVNKTKSVEEYLGKDYPLYYQNLDEVNELLNDDKILEASEYLSKIPRFDSLGKQIQMSNIYKKIDGLQTYNIFNPGDLGLDSLGGIYNPGYIKFNNKEYILPRVEKFTENERGQNSLWRKTSSIPYLIEIDNEFNIKEINKLKLIGFSEKRIEDFRIFEYKNELYTNHILVDDDSIYPVISKIDIKNNKLHFIGKIKLPIEIKNVEKNWTFISINDELFLIYNISPMEIFKVNLDNLTSELYKNIDSNIEWSIKGYVSASTNPIKINEDSYVMGFHTRDKNLIYHQGFLEFDSNFNIINYSKQPVISSGDYQTINPKVIYTMSLKLNEKDKEIQCFCGDGDSKTTVITYKIKELFR